MAVKERDIKLLWSRAAGRCSFSGCSVKLSEDKATVTDSFPLGEQAHIVAEEADGPRGVSVLSKELRNSYTNLILLCPTHHTVIDKNPEDFPVEVLHGIKRNHELRIERVTSEIGDLRRAAEDFIYTTLIDSAVELCHLETWSFWTYAATAPASSWGETIVESFRRFRLKTLTAVWPGTRPELERAIQTLSTVLHLASQRFLEHADLRDDRWVEDRFYRRGGAWNPNYHADLSLYKKWSTDCADDVARATKAANWFADVVRRDVNPMFFAGEGKFTATFGDGEMKDITYVLEFSSEEKASLPTSLTRS